jgi:AAA family ATP:ADP antiporter
MGATPAPAGERPGGLDRALRVFGDVRPGEGAGVLLMFANVFVLLVGYYILKTVREPLILVGGGAELKAYASAAQAMTFLFYVPAYAWVASRLPRRRLVVTVALFFIACIEVFYLGGRLQAPHLGFAFFVWVGIFNMTMVAQFWSFANDIYRREDGERLFPLIAAGQTAGAPLGAALADRLFAGGLSPFTLMQIAAGLVLVHLLLYLATGRPAAGHVAPEAPRLEPGGGFALVFKSRYLLLIAGLLVLLNLVNTVGEYILSRTVVESVNGMAAAPGFDKGAYIGRFFAQYFLGVNILAVLIQAFLVSRLVKHLGMAGVLLALPVVALGAYGMVALGATLAVIRWGKTAENATDYSVMNTAKQMVWLPTSREEKYKAKQATDTFFVRTGDLLSAAVVFAGTQWLALTARGFALANLVFVAAWIGLGVMLLRHHRRLTAGR